MALKPPEQGGEPSKEQPKSAQEALATKEPVVVIGAGPGGLMAAIEAAKKGYKVKVLESRTYFTRPMRVQVMRSQQILLDLIDQMPQEVGQGITAEDVNLLKKVKISLNRWLEEGYEEEAERSGFVDAQGPDAIKVKNLQKALELIGKHLFKDKIEVIKNAKITNINGDTQTLTYQVQTGENAPQNEAPIVRQKFSHCVPADGASRSFMEVLSPGENNKYAVQIKDLETQTRQVAHGVVFMDTRNAPPITEAERPLVPLAPEPIRLTDNHMEGLKNVGWDKPYLPFVYIWSNKARTKWYIAGEVPDSFLTATPEDREKLMETWGRTILLMTEGKAARIREPKSLKPLSAEKERLLTQEEREARRKKAEYLAAKEKLKATCFPVKLTYAVNPCLTLGGIDGAGVKGSLVIIGDASKTANFLLGHGANDAIADAIRFGECLKPDGTFDKEAFEKGREVLMKKLITEMQNLEADWQEQYQKNIETLGKKHDVLVEKIGKLEGVIEKHYKELKENWEKIRGSLPQKDDVKTLKEAIDEVFQKKAPTVNKVDSLYISLLQLVEKLETKELQSSLIASATLATLRERLREAKQLLLERKVDVEKLFGIEAERKVLQRMMDREQEEQKELVRDAPVEAVRAGVIDYISKHQSPTKGTSTPPGMMLTQLDPNKMQLAVARALLERLNDITTNADCEKLFSQELNSIYKHATGIEPSKSSLGLPKEIDHLYREFQVSFKQASIKKEGPKDKQ